MTHQDSITALLEVLRSHRRILVTAHSRPDGDAVGSALALGEVLEQMGHEVDLILADPVPDIYQTLPRVERIRQVNDVGPLPGAVIVLECSSVERTGLQGLEGALPDQYRPPCKRAGVWGLQLDR